MRFRLLVQHQHRIVVAADDQHGRRRHFLERLPSKIGPPASGHDSTHQIGPPRRGHERGGGAGAGAEQPDRQMFQRGLCGGPLHGGDQPIGEQANVETQLPCLVVEVFLLGGEQIHQQRRKVRLLQDPGNELVAVAVTAAAAPVREQHEAACVNGNYEVGIQLRPGDRDPEW